MKPLALVRRSYLRDVLLVCVLSLGGCSDRDVAAPAIETPSLAGAAMLTCTVSVEGTARMDCRPSVGQTMPRMIHSRTPAGMNASVVSAITGGLVLGGQGTNVLLVSTGVLATATEVTGNVTIQNLIGQALGTTDGTTLATEGVRVFFSSGPIANTGTVTVANADGTENFTASGQSYHQYNEILSPNETSAVKQWRFNLAGGATTFTFGVYVWAPVQYPDGWIVITPETDELDISNAADVTTQLSGVVRNELGAAVAGQTITWASVDSDVASVDANGLVTAHEAGTTTITATSGARGGSAVITVIQPPSFSQSLVAADPTTIDANGTSTSEITVTLRDALGNPLTKSAGTITLQRTGTGALNPTVTDNLDGTYTGQLTSPVLPGTAQISAELDGDPLASTVTVTFAPPAVAVDDATAGSSSPGSAYHAAVNTTLNVADGPNDLLANDELGSPAAGVTHFGAVRCNNGNGSGTLTAATDAVTASLVGTAAPLTGRGGCTGGSLTVNANGTLSFTPANNYTGLFQFQYRIGNTGGSSDATVTLAVGVRPSATNSTYATELIGNVPINTATSTGITVATTGDVPAYLVTANTNGTAAIATNGTYSFTPNAGYNGAASFTYTVANGFGTSTPATVSLTVGPAVWFVQAGAAGGGIGTMSSPFNCLVGTSCFDDSANEANDRIYVFTGSYTNNNVLTLKAGQRLIGQASTSPFATISGLAWPVDAGVAPAHNGGSVAISTSTGNLIALGADNTLRGVALGNPAAGAVSLFGTAFGTLTVGSDVSINSTGAAISLNNGTIAGSFGAVSSSGGTNALSFTSVNSAAAVTLTGPFSGATGPTLNVNGGNIPLIITGNITQANNAALLSVSGGHSGAITFETAGTLTASNGSGLQFNNADGTYTFNGATTLSNAVAGGDAGIDVTNGSTGTFAFAATSSITNPAAGNLITITGSAPTFTYAGAFSKANNNVTGISLSNNTGGTISFSGSGVTKSISSGTAAAVSLATNAGTSIQFTGGGLSLTSGSGNGLSATGSGTVVVTGATNTASATGGGTAINIQNVTIGASGITLQSVNASGGGGGIVLQNTGTGAFQVTGTGTVGTGGTIVNSTGADAAIVGNGIYLQNASNVALNWMNLSGHSNHAIRGLDVTNFTMTRVRITGTNGTTVSGEGEGSVYFHGLFGSAAITSSYIEGGIVDNVRVVNTSGTLDRLTMNNDTIGFNGNVGSDGVFLQASGTAVYKATVQNSRFLGSVGDQIQMSNRETANVDFVFTSNVLTNTHPARLPQNFAVAISSGGSGAGYNPIVTYNVSNNSINDVGSTAISIGKGGVGAGHFTGTVSGNTIGTSGVANSGSAQGSAIVVDIVGGGSHTSTITNNTIRQFTNYGILAQSGNTTAGGGQGYLTLTIKGNNIAEPSPASASALFPTSGIRVVTGTNSGDTAKNCVTLGGTIASEKNIVTGTGTNGGLDLRLFQRFATLLGVPSYAGANNDNAAMNAFLTARNTLGTVSATNNTATPGPGYAGACPA